MALTTEITIPFGIYKEYLAREAELENQVNEYVSKYCRERDKNGDLMKQIEQLENAIDALLGWLSEDDKESAMSDAGLIYKPFVLKPVPKNEDKTYNESENYINE